MPVHSAKKKAESLSKTMKPKPKPPKRVYGPQPGGPGYVGKGPKMTAKKRGK
jgi:hypothetical protein